MNLNELANEAHDCAVEHGFWESDNKAEKIALMHSELSEALEAVRKSDGRNLNMDEKCPKFTNEEIEFADCIIRILDYCIHFDLYIEQAIKAKIEYNKTRPYKHGKAF